METITGPEALPMRINRDALVDICRHYHVRELAVFGSVLRDDFDPASDVDVSWASHRRHPSRAC